MVLENLLGELAQEHITPSGAHLVGNARSKFRDGFSSRGVQPNPDTWLVDNEAAGAEGHLILQGGDAAGSSYLRISLSPFVDDSQVRMISRGKFAAPTKIGFGVTAALRSVGQECFVGIAQADDADPLLVKRSLPIIDPIAPTQLVVTTNVATITFPTPHPFKTGDRLILVGFADTRLNVGPVYATVTGMSTLTVPLTIANGTYSGASIVGGFVRHADPLSRVDNAGGVLWENATTTQGNLVARRNGAKYRQFLSQTLGTTVAVQSQTGAWNDSLNAAATQELLFTMDEFSLRSWNADGVSAMTNLLKFSQAFPDEEEEYRLFVRVRTLDSFTRPIARVVSAVKTGTNTATITTDRPHNLTTLSRIGLYGVRDQGATGFTNTTDVAVLTTPSATTFTATIASNGSVTDLLGGVVYLNNGGILPTSAGVATPAIQSVRRYADGLVEVVGSASWGSLQPGEGYHLWGLVAAAQGLEGAYKVMSNTGATAYLLPLDGNPVLNQAVGVTNTGGVLIRRQEWRIHFARVLDHTRHVVEVHGGRGNSSDANNSVPTTVISIPTVNTSVLPHTAEQNESVTPLAAGALYTGATRDMGSDASRRVAKTRVSIRHLAGTTPGVAYMETSDDSTTWTEHWRQPIPSDDRLHVYDIPVPARYIRFRFQNGAVAQTAFRFHTMRFFVNDGGFWNPERKDFPLPWAAALSVGGTVSQIFDLGVNEFWDEVTLNVFGDQGGTLFIDHSTDGTTWRTEGAGQALAPASFATITSKIHRRYVRVRFVNNGSNAQTALDATATLRSR